MNMIWFVILLLPALCWAETTVIGNLAVVAVPEGHVGSSDKQLMASIPNLWCGTQKLGEHVDVEYGEFTRLADGKVFTGHVNQGKVYLEIGKAPAKVAGRYRCEVRTLDKEVHSGNLIIYLPPVLNFASPTKVSEVAEARPPRVTGPERKGLHGESVTLECPILSNPEPMVRWEKDGEPIAPSNSTQFDGDSLILSPLSEEHSGKYRCIADNSFPLFVDGPSMPHQLFYDQDVKVL